MKIYKIIMPAMILFLLIAFQRGSQASASVYPDGLPPLRLTIIQPSEIQYATLIPVTLDRGIDVTHEMVDQCAVDCIKWFWGGTNSLMIMMNRTNSDASAKRAVDHIFASYRGFGDALVNYERGDDFDEANQNFQSWFVQKKGFSGDLVQISTHGNVWIWMVLHVEVNSNDLMCDTPIEHCWQGTYLSYTSELLGLMRLQHRKLALNGYSPIPSELFPIVTITPAPTPPDPQVGAINDLDIFASHPLCALPCLNRLEPGKSTTREIPAFLEKLGVVDEGALSKDGELCVDMSGFSGGVYFYVNPELCVAWKGEIVQTIQLNHWNHPELFYLNRIKATLGTPEQIKAMYGHGLQRYAITLFYPKQFLSIEVRGDFQENNSTRVCLFDRRRQTANITLYAPGTEADALQFYMGEASPFYELSGMEGRMVEDVFNLLRNTDMCFDY